MKTAAYLLGLFPAVATPTFAETIAGRVVSIQDGDTLTVLDASNVQHHIRVNGHRRSRETSSLR
jgi:endonuclease YncB( thermonuclease family)